MKYIDDLSFSGLVGLIQKDEIQAANAIQLLAQEMEEVHNKIKLVEQHLQRLKNRRGSILVGAKTIVQIINKDIPLHVMQNGHLIIVGEDYLTVYKNVI